MNEPVPVLHIEDSASLEEFCKRCTKSKYIGFDTEFVSENRYRPELCLLQVATDDEIALIDTLAVKNVNPFWEMLTAGDHITIAHAAREEFLFCFRACGKRPKKLFDVQLAAGFVGMDYPASYSNLVAHITGEFLAKGETRTDWKRRPLSDRQIQYAIGDVKHLHQLCQRVTEYLEKAERLDWYKEEVECWLDNLQKSETEPQWHRISGASRLNRRALGLLAELWSLRDRHAKHKNRSPKKIIPDDLMIELAKRGSANPAHFKSIRGFENRVGRGLTEDISEAIQAGNDIPDKQLPEKLNRSKSVNMGLVGQFLSTMLGVVCRTKRIAPTLVGTTQELKNLAAWRMGQLPKSSKPALSEGWRAEIMGDAIDKALAGKLALRVEDPKSDHPLTIEELP